MTAPQAAPQAEQGSSNRQGVRALTAAATAIAGLVLVVNPDNAVARALTSALPALGDALPVVITACGTIVAAFSQPPRLRSGARQGGGR